MKKILMSIVVMMMVIAAAAGGGIYAAFMDTESSTGNSLLAGTLDLKTNDADGVTGTLAAGNMKPGDIVDADTVTLKNAGSIDASSLDIIIDYTKIGTGTPTADEFADEVVVLTLTYGATDLLAPFGPGEVTMKDLKDDTGEYLLGLDGLNASQANDFEISIQLRSGIGNEFQADGIDITFTFLLKQ